MEWLDPAQLGQGWPKQISSSVVSFGLVWCGLIWSILAWSGLVYPGVVWSGQAKPGLVWVGGCRALNADTAGAPTLSQRERCQINPEEKDSFP